MKSINLIAGILVLGIAIGWFIQGNMIRGLIDILLGCINISFYLSDDY